MSCAASTARSSVALKYLHTGGSDPLDDRRDPLPAADAERGEAVALLTLAQLVHQRQREARAGCAERMAQRDRAAIHVRALAIEPEVLLHREVLRREGLVDLDEVHVGHLETRPLERLTR